ncbi:MAG TPA: HEAT repeat domain-containing protein, partial [Gemmatales bacterium]|nr:HEAT repeat domain-containing protein [Gemmatales bacterium]
RPAPAPAAPVDPHRRVHELLQTLRNDPKPDRRENAAFNLRSFSAEVHFEIVPALIDSLQQDSVPAVRRAALQSLAEIQPRSAEVLEALEHAAEHDDSWRVRQSARWAKRGYQVPTEQPKATPAPTPAMVPKASPTQPAEAPARFRLFPFLSSSPTPAPTAAPVAIPAQAAPPAASPSPAKRLGSLFDWLKRKPAETAAPTPAPPPPQAPPPAPPPGTFEGILKAPPPSR